LFPKIDTISQFGHPKAVNLVLNFEPSLNFAIVIADQIDAS